MAANSTFGYAKTDDGIYLGYRVDGDGPIDIVCQSDWPGNIDLEWVDPLIGSWLRELRSFSRVITHDPRGIGLSSRNVDLPTLETRVSDLMTVLNAIGVRRPVLVGYLSTGAVNILAAAMRPRLARAIVWLEPAARYAWAEDFPWGTTPEELQGELDFIDLWGTDAYGRAFVEEQEAMGNVMPPETATYMPKATRGSCTPDVARKMVQIWAEIDVRSVLEAVQVPTLLLVHKDRKASVDEAEYIAAKMPAAEVRAMPGDAWRPEDGPAWAEHVRDFIGVERTPAALDTVLATVLFTDIVGSTQRSSEIGSREVEGSASATSRGRARCAAPSRRHRSGHGRGWLLRNIRRTRAGDPVRPRYRGPCSRIRDRDPRGHPHRRVRADRRQGGRARCLHRGPGGGERRSV